MKQVLGYLGTFLLGVICTVSVYEVIRVANTAQQALNAASSQMLTDDGPKPQAATARKSRSPRPLPTRPAARPTERPAGGRLPMKKAERAPLMATRRGVRAFQDKSSPAAQEYLQRRTKRAERIKQRRAAKWAALSPEEQDRIREVRQARLDALSTPGAGLDAPPRSASPAEDEELLLRSEEDDIEFVDTGLK